MISTRALTSSLMRASLALGVLLLSASTASAELYTFSCITNNDPTDCGILEAQLTLDVNAGPSNTVNFRFANTGPAASSLTDVYFSDLLSPLLGLPSFITDSGSGVSFASGCSPGNLPGGNPYGFTTSYCADSNAPVQPLGVNPGEWLNIAYTLLSGAVVQDVIDALDSGAYRVGIHVQGFAGGGSEAGIARRVPEPSSLLLLGMAALLTPFVRRLHA